MPTTGEYLCREKSTQGISFQNDAGSGKRTVCIRENEQCVKQTVICVRAQNRGGASELTRDAKLLYLTYVTVCYYHVTIYVTT